MAGYALIPGIYKSFKIFFDPAALLLAEKQIWLTFAASKKTGSGPSLKTIYEYQEHCDHCPR